MTTLFLRDKALSIDHIKQALLVDVQRRAREIYSEGKIWKSIICIKKIDQLNVPELRNNEMSGGGNLNSEEVLMDFKERTIKLLNSVGIGRECICFIDELNGEYLKSLGNYVFKDMIKKKLIQNIPVCDIRMGENYVRKELMIKLYLRKPYLESTFASFENDARPLFFIANCDNFQELFSIREVSISFNENYGIYETLDNELMICNKLDVKNVSNQNRNLLQAQYSSIGHVQSSVLDGIHVSCSILPFELTIVQRYSSHRIPCLNANTLNGKCSTPESIYSFINSELVDNDDKLIVVNSDSNVIIYLDDSIDSNLLRYKQREKKLDKYKLSEAVESLFIRRGLGFYYTFNLYSFGTIPFENRWCLLTRKKWANQISQRIRNQIVQELISSNLRDIILSREEEFEPDEYSYNYIISSTFLICLDYFKSNNISVDQLNDQVWNYILSMEDSRFIDDRFTVLRQIIQNQQAISIINEPVYGARSAFFSSFLKKVPDCFIIHERFRYGQRVTDLFRPQTLLQTNFDLDSTFSDSIGVAICTSSSLAYLKRKNDDFESSIIEIMKKLKNLNENPTNDHVDSIFDEHLTMQALKVLKTSKQHYFSGNYSYLISTWKQILALSVHVVKMKKKLNQDCVILLRNFYEIMSVFLYPLAPKLGRYIWKDVLKHKGKIHWPEQSKLFDEQCKITSKKFFYLTRLFKYIEKSLKKVGHHGSLILAITASEKNREFDEQQFITENKHNILQKFNQISDIQINFSTNPRITPNNPCVILKNTLDQ